MTAIARFLRSASCLALLFGATACLSPRLSESLAPGPDAAVTPDASGTDADSPPPSGKTYRVGTVSAIQSALNQSRPGDLILVKNGTYPDAKILFERKGASDAPIVLKAETTGGVIFTGASVLTVTGQWLRVEGFSWIGARATPVFALKAASDCVVSRNLFRDAGPAPTVGNGAFRISQGSVRNQVLRNEFDNLPAQGIRVICSPNDCGNTHNRIAYNHFHSRQRAEMNNGESIQLGSGMVNGVRTVKDQFTVVEHNLFEDIDYSQEMISNKTNRNTYRFNTFRNNRDTLVLRMGSDVRVYGNWFINTKGLRIYEPNHRIYHNHFESVSSSGAFEVPYAANQEGCHHWTADNLQVSSNTVVGVVKAVVLFGQHQGETIHGCLYDRPPVNGVYENNLFDTFQTLVGEPVAATYRGNVAWPKSLALPGVLYADPGVVRDSVGAFRSAAYPDRGARMKCPALVAAQVGPASTFIAGNCEP